MRKFILVAWVCSEADPEDRSILFLAGMGSSKQGVRDKMAREYGERLLGFTVYTAEEFEEVSQHLLSAEPDPPWRQVSRN